MYLLLESECPELRLPDAERTGAPLVPFQQSAAHPLGLHEPDSADGSTGPNLGEAVHSCGALYTLTAILVTCAGLFYLDQRS